MKRILSSLVAIIMIFTLSPVCFASEKPSVFAQITELSSGNILVSFYGENLKGLTNAVFSVEYNKEAFSLLKAYEATTEIDGESFSNFSGLWTFGERTDGKGAAAGYISASGASKKGKVKLCEFELGRENIYSPNGTVKAYVFELTTNDGNFENDIMPGDEVLLASGKFTTPAAGDLNGDSVFDVLDAVCLERYVSGHTSLTEDELSLADINCDGDVNYRDFYLLLRLEGEKITELDVNGDTVLDVLDLVLLERALWRDGVLDERQYAIADINCDGEYTADDYSAAVNAALAF